MGISDDELDNFIKEELTPDIDQADSIDPEVEKHLQEMGFLYDTVHKKIETDRVCFSCKEGLKEGELLYLMEANSKEKGLVCFVSVCKKCREKLEQKNGV